MSQSQELSQEVFGRFFGQVCPGCPILRGAEQGSLRIETSKPEGQEDGLLGTHIYGVDGSGRQTEHFVLDAFTSIPNEVTCSRLNGDLDMVLGGLGLGGCAAGFRTFDERRDTVAITTHPIDQ